MVLAFYDGNDVIDTEQEWQDLRRYQQDGWRPYRVPEPQTSLIKAAYRLLRDGLGLAPLRSFQDAWLTTGGIEQPITLRPAPMPVDPDSMTADQRQALEQAVQDYAATAKELGMTPWLLHVPANNRTYHGLVRFSERAGALALVLRTGDTMSTTQGLKTISKVDFPDTGFLDRRWEQPIMDSTGRLIIFVTFTDGATSQVLVP